MVYLGSSRGFYHLLRGLIMSKRYIDLLLSRVPRLGASWRYLPLRGLPEGTELILTAKAAVVDPDPPIVNGEPETDVQRLPEGTYTLVVGLWPTIYLSSGEQTLPVKSLLNNIAPTSYFTANYDINDTTQRITTGPIKEIRILGTRYHLTDRDCERPRQHRRRPRVSRLGAI